MRLDIYGKELTAAELDALFGAADFVTTAFAWRWLTVVCPHWMLADSYALRALGVWDHARTELLAVLRDAG